MGGEQTDQEIYAALRQLREEPYGPTRSARAEELVETAEQSGLDAPLATALLELMSAYEYGAEPQKSPLAFTRLLKLYDAEPDAFDEREVYQLYWRFKWVTTSLLTVPEVPLASLHGWVEQMRERYRAAGHRMHAVYASKFALAAHSGVDVDAAYEAWATRPRDTYSDCEACEARFRGRYRVARGEDARALEEWAPVLDGKLTCAEEPAATIAEALLPLVRAGRLDEAASFHRSGYRLTRANINMADQAGRHMEFAALTGNLPRALELLAENRGRLDAAVAEQPALDPLTALEFLGGVRVLLTRLVAQGRGSIPVPGPTRTEHTAESLLADLTARTDALAARFDARNGTSRISDWCRERYAREPLLAEQLPLGIRSAPKLPGAEQEAMDAANPAAGAGSQSASAGAAGPSTQSALPADFADLLAEGRAASVLGRPGYDRLWEAIAQRVTDQDLDDLLRAELAEFQAEHAEREADWATALELRELARDHFAAADEPGRATVAAVRAVCYQVRLPVGGPVSWDRLDELLAEAARLLDQGRLSPSSYTLVRHLRVSTAVATHFDRAGADDTDQAGMDRLNTELALLRAEAERLGQAHRLAVAAALEARLAGLRGDIDTAVAGTRESVAHAERSDRPWIVPDLMAQLGSLLAHTGQAEEGVAVLHRAITLAAEYPGCDFDHGKAALDLGEIGLATGDLQEAARRFSAAAARFDREERAAEATGARGMLGQALLRADRFGDAVAVLESVLTEEADKELPLRQRAQTRLDLARGLVALDEHRSAAETYLALADLVADLADPLVTTLVLGELASSLARAGMPAEARTASERALTAHRAAANPALICLMLRTCAEAVISDGPEEDWLDDALAYLDRSDEVNEAAPEAEGKYRRWPERALNADLRVQALARVRRDEPALAACEQAVAAWAVGADRALDRLAEAVRIAAVIEGHRLGRRDAAFARLGPMAERCRAAGLTRQAEQLARLRSDLAPAGA